MKESEIILYTTPQGDVKIDIRFEEETFWLSQKKMAELFDVDVRTINEHLKNIFESGELDKDPTIRKFRIVQMEGSREVTRQIEFYNLDAIIAVGYRVNSYNATQFRIWATKTLKEFLIKGFVMDDERLKQGQNFGKDYFDELLDRIRSIRASERRFYQKITDLYAEASIDYDPKAPITRESKDNLLRIYSLNYDKILQVLFDKVNIPILQGFDTGEQNTIDRLNYYGVQAEPKTVLFERDKHCIYHLHGNANWKIIDYNDNKIESYEYRLMGTEEFNSNNANIGIKMEQGKPLFLTNIVTGYQKTQRTSLSPLRQMMSAFDMDCYTADELIIIGYSFGDEHINDIIRQAKKHNKKLQIKVIDPGFNRGSFAINLASNWGDLGELKNRSNVGDSIIKIEDLSIEVYKVGFKEYLKKYA